MLSFLLGERVWEESWANAATATITANQLTIHSIALRRRSSTYGQSLVVGSGLIGSSYGLWIAGWLLLWTLSMGGNRRRE